MKSVLLALLRRVATRVRVAGKRRFLKHGSDLHVGARSKLWAPRHLVIGDHVYIGKDVHIETNARIGNYCLIANRVGFVGRHDHDFREVGIPVRFSRWVASQKRPSPAVTEEVLVEDDVWIGYGSIVLSGTTIRRGAVVAAGSVVTKDIPAYAIAAGVPARVLGTRFETPETIRVHEAMIQSGHFESSEQGYDFFLIQPGPPS